MFFRSYVAEHRGSVPSNHSGSDCAGYMIVTGRDISRQRPQRVKWRLMAPFQLLVHILLDHVHRDMAGTLVHNLDTMFPGPASQLALSVELAELRFIVGVRNRTRTKSVTDRKRHIVRCHDLANFVPMRVEKVLLMMSQTPFRQDRTTA